MKFDWESDEQRLKKFMKISPKKKMEWLHEMHTFMWKASSDEVKAIRWKLREQDVRTKR